MEEEAILRLCHEIAVKAHAGQADKAGAPYIGHPERVSARCATTRQKCAALLHDVLEDTPTTADDLLAQGVPADVVAVVQKLTHPDGVPYMDYVRGIAGDPDARAVKMSDLTDNMDLSRLPEVIEKDRERVEKYKRAFAILEEARAFMSGATREAVLAYAREQYDAEERHLWAKYPLYAVLRHGETGKWFGLVADVPREKLGLPGEGIADVLVVKANPVLVPALIERSGHLPAYHMNKRNWVSVLLDGTVPEEDALALLDESWRLTR